MTRNRIGSVSAAAAQGRATVCQSELPTPTAKSSPMASQRSQRRPAAGVRAIKRRARNATAKKARLLTAFSGSAHSSGPARSQ